MLEWPHTSSFQMDALTLDLKGNVNHTPCKSPWCLRQPAMQSVGSQIVSTASPAAAGLDVTISSSMAEYGATLARVSTLHLLWWA